MKLKYALVALAALAGAALSSETASAVPNGLPIIKNSDVEQVRWVCNPMGTLLVEPNYYGAYGFYGPPRFYGPRFYAPVWAYGPDWDVW